LIAALLGWLAIHATPFEPVATVYTAANVARCESSARYDDGAAVLATAMTRARTWKRPLLAVLRQRYQFATSCPWSPRTWSWRHVHLGIEAASGTLRAPEWTRRAFHYCNAEPAETCANRRGEFVGQVVHSFYAWGG
jgi:hypothetical protein